MNHTHGYVTKVLGVPYQMLGRWHITVEVKTEGYYTIATPMFGTQVEAASIKVGSKILI